MNKKVKIILSVLLVIAILSFVIFKVLEFKKEKEENLNFITIKDFIEKKMDNETIIENQEIGLSFVLPQGWEFVNTNWANISMRTFDYEPFMNEEERLPLLNKGCWIDFNFSTNSTKGLDYETLFNILNLEGFQEAYNEEGNKAEIITIGDLKVVKETKTIGEEKGEFISVKIPFNKNRVYSFETYLMGQDKEKCLEIFNSFLNSISIK
ncbi:MAG: hypothetical protein MCSN_4110 [Candidatus Microsyncoccus archaeolyticus]|nr:MAG: hypothetical protein MCSN_4110 [Candidatus Parcubacteria bacterium]